MRDMHLFQVKTPAESKSEWDLYKFVSAVSGKDAAPLISEGHCRLVTP